MKTELKNINFFRILLTLCIVYGHIMQHYMIPMYPDIPLFQYLMKHTSYHYNYMVEMFFIMSGFFMFFTFKKTTSFKSLLINKIARLWPVIIFCIGVSYILSLFHIYHYYRYDNILAAFFLSGAFVESGNNIGVAWYINVIFWCFILYHFLFKIIKPENKIPVMVILTFIAYSILFNKVELYEAPSAWNEGFLTFRMIRGIAGMGLGYLIANWYTTWKKPKKVTLLQNIFIGILEGFLFFLLIKWSVIKNIPQYLTLMVLLFVLLFILFLSQKGFISRFLNNNICFQFGKYCYSIYLVQCFMFEILKKFIWPKMNFEGGGLMHYPALNIFVSIVLICIVGIIVHYAVEKPCAELIKKKFG